MDGGPPEYPDEVNATLNSAKELHRWIAERQDNLEIPNQLKSLLPGLLFDLSIEHHVGVISLIDGHVNGSAFALLRGAMEAMVRGAWIQQCATDDDIKRFYEQDKLPDGLTFGDMVDAIEKHADFPDQLLSTLKHNSWKAMNSHTHAGMLPISRRIKGNSIEPNFEPEELIEVLKATGTFALISLRQIAKLAGHDGVAEEVNARLS